jgi:pimeloyl-ACP methyl ester carboxylesterase
MIHTASSHDLRTEAAPILETRRFQAHGLQLTADVGGDFTSPAVVLLHGGGQTRHAWGSTARAASGRYVVSLDLRGHGDSDWDPNGDYSQAAADAVAAYLPHRPRPASPSGLRRNLRLRADGRYYWHWDPALFNRLKASPQYQRSRYEAAARRVRVPTLLVRGQRSELVTPADVQHFLSLIPSARYVDIAGAAHMVAGDRNDAFSIAILSFLNDPKARTSSP